MFIIRDYADLSRPDASGKVIKAKDFWAFKEAERALADAKQQKEQIISSARDAYEAERQRGYAEGNEEARLEQSGSIVEIVSHTVEYFGKVETQMVDLVLDAVRKVVSDFDDRQRVTTVVKNCLDLVRSQKHLTLHVNPAQVDYLRSQIGELQKIYPSILQIEIHPDARLGLDACVVESEIGIVEASLTGQVEMLREALSTVFAPQDAQPQERVAQTSEDSAQAQAEVQAQEYEETYDDYEDPDQDDDEHSGSEDGIDARRATRFPPVDARR